MGAFQTGFSMGQRAYEHALAQKRQEEVDARRKVLEGRQDAEYNEAQNLKVSMADAAKLAEVRGVTPTYQPEVDDEGNAMPANPTLAGGYRVNGQQFADQAAAEKFAAGYNAPTAQMQRVAGVLKGAGQIDRALDMEGRAKQAQAADIQLTQAQRQEADQLWLRELGKAVTSRDPNQIAKFYNDAYDDGMTAEIIPGKDGALSVVRKTKDGKEVERGDFANYDQFIGAVLPQFLATRDPVKSLQLQWDRQEKAEARADREEGKKHRDRVQTAVEKFQDAQIGNMRETQRLQSRLLNIREAGGGAAPNPEAALKDRRDALSDFEKLLGKLGDDADDAALANRTRALSQADGMFQLNAEAGVTLTAPQIRTAMQLATDPTKRRVIRNTGTGEQFEAVVVNGRPVIVGKVRVATPTATPGGTAAPAPTNGVGPAPQAAPSMVRTARSLGDASQFEAMSDAELARYVKAGNEIAKAVAAERRARAGSGDRALMQEAASQGITPQF